MDNKSSQLIIISWLLFLESGMATKFGVLHGSALLLVLYVFVNSFLIGIQISPDFHLITLPFSYVTQFVAMITGFLMILGFVQYFYYSAGESGVGKLNLGSVVGLAFGIAGVVLFASVILTNYQLDSDSFNKYLGGYLFFGSFIILIAWRELLVNFGKVISKVAK